MKKIIVFTIFFLSSVGFVFSQSNYNGKLGYGFSPKGHPVDYSQMGNFLQEVANTCNGEIVFANAVWRDSLASSGTIPNLQKTISLLQPSPYSYVDMIDFGWGSPTTPYTLYLDVPGNAINNWTNSNTKNLFLQMLIHAADSLQPAYMFLGNEISFYWAQDSVDYMNYVSFYEQAYDSIKIHSPSTKVGVIFNYEHLSGNGPLVGFNTAYWNALNVFDTSRVDIFGFTVYPFFKYTTANAVPLNYLDPVFNKIGNKAVAITETGWPADSILATWYCSPQQQVDYVNRIFSIINGHNVEVVNWLFLYYLMDQSTQENQLACSIALYDSLANPQPALPVWLSYCNTTGMSKPYEENNYEVNTFPNPSNGEFTVHCSKFPVKNAEIKIYDLLGKEVFSTPFTNTEMRINPPLQSGIYFLQIRNGNYNLTKKLIEQ